MTRTFPRTSILALALVVAGGLAVAGQAQGEAGGRAGSDTNLDCSNQQPSCDPDQMDGCPPPDPCDQEPDDFGTNSASINDCLNEPPPFGGAGHNSTLEGQAECVAQSLDDAGAPAVTAEGRIWYVEHDDDLFDICIREAETELAWLRLYKDGDSNVAKIRKISEMELGLTSHCGDPFGFFGDDCKIIVHLNEREAAKVDTKGKPPSRVNDEIETALKKAGFTVHANTNYFIITWDSVKDRGITDLELDVRNHWITISEASIEEYNLFGITSCVAGGGLAVAGAGTGGGMSVLGP